jgi:hypothetical protein
VGHPGGARRKVRQCSRVPLVTSLVILQDVAIVIFFQNEIDERPETGISLH